VVEELNPFRGLAGFPTDCSSQETHYKLPGYCLWLARWLFHEFAKAIEMQEGLE